MIDTGAMLAFVDADDRHHKSIRRLFEKRGAEWVLPWAILPEVDYLLSTHVSRRAEQAFVADLADGVLSIVWGEEDDFSRAHALCSKYKGLHLGLVDASVIAVAERLGASEIATLDVRHFGAVEIKGRPRLLPRDL